MQEEYQNPSLQNQAQDRQVPLDVGSGVPAGSQSNVNPNGEKKGLVSKILSVFEVGLFEIVFVAVTLCLFFFILNYFNLIRLWQIYPKELGFLPHRPYQSQTDLTVNTADVLKGRRFTSPIYLTDPSVDMAGVSYALTGSVAFIEKLKNEDAWRLIFKSRAGNILPQDLFTLLPTTPIFASMSSAAAALKPPDLKKNDKITIYYWWDLKTEQGSITSIRKL
ncbi:hypothetical protein M1615_01095 [Patescibacteria group bacterium]|nr:hypothetical protein [Patescibacteria group bacterium]MCL5010474.1 hypothetical protein [Patescibacteria group bacterium]